ncbi:MAG: ATP-binding protein [Coriobacteriia bacterium]
MNPEVFLFTADVVALFAFTAAFLLALTIPMDFLGPQYVRTVRSFLALALAIYVFASGSNVLQHAGVTAALDPFEDYAEILFIPFLAYVAHVASMALQVNDLSRAERVLRSEHELLTTIVDTSPGGTMFVASNGAITFASDRARDLLGLIRPDDRSTWQLPSSFVGMPSFPGEPPLHIDYLSEGVSLSDVGCIVESNDTGKLALSVSASPLTDESGSTLGSVVTFVDVTEREKARQDLLDAQARYNLDLERTVDERTAELLDLNVELSEANRAKRDLLANVSHELRTPLNVIIGFTDVLAGGLAGPVTEEQAKQLAMVKESSVQLLSMVNDLLDIERIEAGRTVVAAETVDLGQAVGRLVETMRPLALQRALTVSLSAPDGLELTTDPRLLSQIVRNLLSNAIKFTPPYGHVSVTVTDTGDGCCIAVTDDGIGIAAEDQAHVFDAFTQVHGEHGRKPDGTGLGLAICRDMTALLGGTITVTSDVGAGATFEVTLSRDIPRSV